MPPKTKKNAPPTTPTPRRGTHKSRNQPQPPPEFNSNIELTSTDDSPAMREIRQMLGSLNTDMATMSYRMDQFQASSVDITAFQPAAAVLSAQPGTRAGVTSSATRSSIDSTRHISQHWPSRMMKLTGRRKLGLRQAGELPVHQVSYDQLILQPYVKSFGLMNTCIPVKASRPNMCPWTPWLLSRGT